MNSRQTRFDSLRIFFRQLITNANHIIHQLFNNNEQKISPQSTQSSITKFTVMQSRIITILGYLLMLVICIVGVEYVLNVPSQRQISAIDLVADNGVTIRDIEKNDQGVAFRWLSDQVSLTIPQPTNAGILIFDYWIAPQRVATALLINSTTTPLPPTKALTQRRISILVFHADGMPQTNIALKFGPVSQKSIAWAFTSATWQSITPIFHSIIWIVLGVIALLIVLSLQRIFQRHWLSMAGTSLFVIAIPATQPVFITPIMALINNPKL